MFAWDGKLYALEKYVTLKPEDVGLESCTMTDWRNKKWFKLIDINYADDVEEIYGKEVIPCAKPNYGMEVNNLWAEQHFWLTCEEASSD